MEVEIKTKKKTVYSIINSMGADCTEQMSVIEILKNTRPFWQNILYNIQYPLHLQPSIHEKLLSYKQDR